MFDIRLKQPEQKNIIKRSAIHCLITKKYKGKPNPKPLKLNIECLPSSYIFSDLKQRAGDKSFTSLVIYLNGGIFILFSNSFYSS